MKVLIGIFLCIFVLLWAGLRIYNGIVFDINCEGYLKRAADANTVEIAHKQLRVALDYIEKNKLTEGYTSIIYKTPDEDISFWYGNLNASLGELENISPRASQLEKSNLLMKLRETLLDNDQKGISVTLPMGISIYPNNLGYAMFGIFSLFMVIGGIVLIIRI